MSEGNVYILHLQSLLRHARHYLGWSKDVDARIQHHRANGSCIYCECAESSQPEQSAAPAFGSDEWFDGIPEIQF